MNFNHKPKCILYFPYEIDFERQSASSIRPQKIIESFKNSGIDPFIIVGNTKTRKKRIQELKKTHNSGVVYDFVYCESSTMPLLLTDDHHLPLHPLLDIGFFRFCKKNNIKIGLFYRDIQWKFSLYDDNVNIFKAKFAKFFYRNELKIYKKYLDILYLPSIKMSKMLPELSGLIIKTLPPALDDVYYESISSDIDSSLIKLFYAGGIMNIYDLTPTLELLNLNEKYQLHLVCRKFEWEIMKREYLSKLIRKEQLVVHHVGRKQLPDIISKTNYSLFVLGKQAYLDFAIPFKIFDYIQFSRPILTLNGTAVSEFVEKNNVGKSFGSVREIDEYLRQLNKKQYEKLVINISKSRYENTWSKRVEQLINELS